jgi:Fe-S cluster biogenesis protein NfuA
MKPAADDRDFRQRMERLETLLHEVERFPDPATAAHARQLVQAVLDLHGAGLEKMLETIAGGEKTGVALIEDLAQDELVGGLLVLHGLHPLALETRVRQALDKVRPRLRSHGGDVKLLGVVRGVVRLRMTGGCDGCASSDVALRRAVEEAVAAAAPDAAGVEVEATTNGRVAGARSQRIALPVLHR